MSINVQCCSFGILLLVQFIDAFDNMRVDTEVVITILWIIINEGDCKRLKYLSTMFLNSFLLYDELFPKCEDNDINRTNMSTQFKENKNMAILLKIANIILFLLDFLVDAWLKKCLRLGLTKKVYFK